ncbi:MULTISPECIES: hypothetical protein [Rhodomicrobium]|uniref:hypothetical protein n=1 Tax=Rhodomicrobium TaxID=1068 RepID=UPI000F74837A|nr:MULTISPECIES: hypothetical protein [Rhodomicrobium]
MRILTDYTYFRRVAEAFAMKAEVFSNALSKSARILHCIQMQGGRRLAESEELAGAGAALLLRPTGRENRPAPTDHRREQLEIIESVRASLLIVRVSVTHQMVVAMYLSATSTGNTVTFVAIQPQDAVGFRR